MILALVYPIVLGLDRLETASFLRSNGTFQYLTGLPSFPDPQTLRRFLLHAPDSFWEQMHRVNDRLLQNFIHLPDHRSRLIFDLDSSVVTVFGRQQGGGRLQSPLSWQAFLQSAVVPGSQLLLSVGYRTAAGNAGTWDGSVELLETCFSTYRPISVNSVSGRMPVLVSIRSWKSSKPSRAICSRGPPDPSIQAIASGLTI